MKILDTISQSKLKFSFILLMILVFYNFLRRKKKQFISKKVLLKNVSERIILKTLRQIKLKRFETWEGM